MRVPGVRVGLGTEPVRRVFRPVVYVLLRRMELALFVVRCPQYKVGVAIPGRLVREVRCFLPFVPVQRRWELVGKGDGERLPPSQNSRPDLFRVTDRVSRIVLVNDLDGQPDLFGGLLRNQLPVASVIARQ